MVEFRDDGIAPPCLMEVNGRFWGSLQLSIDAGINFPLLWASMLKGEHVEPVSDYKEGVTLRWLWGDVKRLMYIMAGAPKGYTQSFPTRWEGIKELLGAQPAGTRLEVVRFDDPLPALAEWFEGIRELIAWKRGSTRGSNVQSKSPASAMGSNINYPAVHD
jgi:hypothetical protein